jgi:GTP-binding protein
MGSYTRMRNSLNLWPDPHSYITNSPSAPTLALGKYYFQLHHRKSKFDGYHPVFSEQHFRTLPYSDTPEILLVGRSNVGKSSLLNALLGVPTKKFASESTKPGHTRELQAWPVGKRIFVKHANPRISKMKDKDVKPEKKIVQIGEGFCLVDSPGYGPASREMWGREIKKYLTQRKAYVHSSS